MSKQRTREERQERPGPCPLPNGRPPSTVVPPPPTVSHYGVPGASGTVQNSPLPNFVLAPPGQGPGSLPQQGLGLFCVRLLQVSHAAMMRKPNRSRVWHPHRVFLSSACLQGAAAIAQAPFRRLQDTRADPSRQGLKRASLPILGEAKSQSPSSTKVWPMAPKGETNRPPFILTRGIRTAARRDQTKDTKPEMTNSDKSKHF